MDADSDEVVVVYEYTAQLQDELSLKVGDVITKVERMEGGWWRGDLAGVRGMFPDNFVKVLPSSSSTNLQQSSSGEPVQMRNKKRCRVLFSYQPVHDDELELKVDQVLEFMGEVEDGWWKGRYGGRVGVFPSNFVELCNDEKEKYLASVEEHNSRNIHGANIVKDVETDSKSTKQDPEDIHNKKPSSTKQGEDNIRKMSASQRSQIGQDSPPPDTAPRLPPKPVKEQCLVLFPYTAQNEDELTLQEGQMITIITKDCEDKGWWKGELDGRVGVFPDNFVKRVSQHITAPEEMKPAVAVMPETPEKPKFQSLKPSTSKDNIKKLFETSSGPSSVLSKATSFEKLKSDKIPDYTSLKVEEEKRNSENKHSNKITEMNKKVTNIKNELSKSELFNKTLNKTEAPSKPKPSSAASSRSSLSSVISESDKVNKEAKRRTSEPIPKEEHLDDVAPTSKLTHPTASRVKAPKRRPPSQHFLKENIPDELDKEIEDAPKEITKAEDEKEKVVETEEVSNKTKFLENPLNKPIGAIQVMPSMKPSGTSPDSKPSWMEEFSRKKANRKSGIFAEKQEAGGDDVKAAPPQKPLENKPDKPTPPKADTKPSIANKPESDIAEIRKSFTRDKSHQNIISKLDSSKTKSEEAEVEKRAESGKSDRPTRPSLPTSLISSSVSPNRSNVSELKRNSDIVRHSSESSKASAERKHSDLSRKHSDSSRHSDKSDKPAVHSANLGNPEKFSFAKPERPVMDKVLSKNDKNIAKSESIGDAPEKPGTNDNVIGWRSDLITNNRVTDILACKESNGYMGKEKENISGPCKNISGPCKELQEVKSCLLEIQTEFQLQVKTLKRELEDEKQARIKLEAEVRALKKIVNKT